MLGDLSQTVGAEGGGALSKRQMACAGSVLARPKCVHARSPPPPFTAITPKSADVAMGQRPMSSSPYSSVCLYIWSISSLASMSSADDVATLMTCLFL